LSFIIFFSIIFFSIIFLSIFFFSIFFFSNAASKVQLTLYR